MAMFTSPILLKVGVPLTIVDVCRPLFHLLKRSKAGFKLAWRKPARSILSEQTGMPRQSETAAN